MISKRSGAKEPTWTSGFDVEEPDANSGRPARPIPQVHLVGRSRQIKISPIEANYWWRRNDPAGALLNNLMFLFIVVPIGLVLRRFYVLSFVVFAFMVPYGLLVR